MDREMPGMKRVTVRQKCPNPLFEEWLDEWRQEAANKGSDMQYCFGKALKSLRKYPLPLKSGKECAILECFGDRLCLLLDKKLAEYCKTHPEVDFSKESEAAASADREMIIPRKRKKACEKSNEDKTSTVQKSPRQRREYVPAWRSGPYAILITLLSNERIPGNPGFMTKASIQNEAQPHCDCSFTRPDPGSHYTAWSSMSLLVKKGLVQRYSNPAKFCLTDNGRHLAEQLIANGEPEEKNHPKSQGEGKSRTKDSAPLTVHGSKLCDSGNSLAASNSTNFDSISVTKEAVTRKISYMPSTSVPSRTEDINFVQKFNHKIEDGESCGDVVLDPGTFDIILLVDTAETAGAAKKRHDQTLAELTEKRVNFEVRRLAVGDFIWIARSKYRDVELVLPYVVERKRMDDFGASVKDSRFREQKFRLKHSGVQNVIYLVESHGSDQHVGLPLATLQQAAVNTQVVEEFVVKHSTDHRHSMAYLATVTSILKSKFLGKTLLACLKEDLVTCSIDDDFMMLMNFREFNKSSGKIRNFLVREMFIRHLLQLKGLSVERALAIVEHYPTPTALVSAFCELRDENLLTHMKFGPKNSNIGPVISKALSHLYSEEKLT